MHPPLHAISSMVLAGILVGSVTACSKDLPTGPAAKPGGAQPAAADRAPANDDFADAAVITALPFTSNINTSRAKTESDDPLNDETCGFGSIGGHTVWYQFTPTEAARINVSTAGSGYDPNVFVYTGTRGNLTRVACNFLPASATFNAVAGQTYYVLVGSEGDDPGGNLVLLVDLSLQVGVTIDPVGTVDSKTGVATITGTVTCSKPAFVELGGSIQQRKVIASQGSLFASLDCDGVAHWEAATAGDNGRFTPGSAVVSAGALFTAGQTTEEQHGGPTTETVLLEK